jgi:hypothetical protein
MCSTWSKLFLLYQFSRTRHALTLTCKTDISSVDWFSDRQTISSVKDYSSQQIKVKRVYGFTNKPYI